MYKYFLSVVAFAVFNSAYAYDIVEFQSGQIDARTIYTHLINDYGLLNKPFKADNLNTVTTLSNKIENKGNRLLAIENNNVAFNECVNAYLTLSALGTFYKIILEIVPANLTELKEEQLMESEGERMYLESKEACEIAIANE